MGNVLYNTTTIDIHKCRESNPVHGGHCYIDMTNMFGNYKACATRLFFEQLYTFDPLDEHVVVKRYNIKKFPLLNFFQVV